MRILLLFNNGLKKRRNQNIKTLRKAPFGYKLVNDKFAVAVREGKFLVAVFEEKPKTLKNKDLPPTNTPIFERGCLWGSVVWEVVTKTPVPYFP